MHQPIEIYLGKNSQTYGPYTIEQFAAIQLTPEFATYTYIWDGREEQPDWRPLEKAPARPASPPRKNSPSPPPADTRAVLRGYNVPQIDAVCHDSRNVITGKLMQVTDTGCELVCSQNAMAPGFGSTSQIMLNLLEPQSGRTMNVAARLNGVKRQNGQWSLQVLWNGCPELIVQLLEKSA